ncbi:hypothetical protein NE850_25925 [Paraburkholderia sp. USG1]|uniref:hypothetical protein n=1 Tax=Paraburkholderia sp. USG1 TaxID=2952268 RepID=UPI0028580A9F|nr:hypothetical protein [Paraburkholderia sp. USG1]MDR8399750.1 hypothetical protein [Paraburkholderia sp. USG1]
MNPKQLALQQDMENSRPPVPPEPEPGEPRLARKADVEALQAGKVVTRSIAGAASLFSNSCEGGDSYDNNCAHFLSNAFIRAGYSELHPQNACITARCATCAKRPIRARDMWCWFKFMQKDSRTTLPKNDGFWAVFQLNESKYWGGHVVIIDTDTNIAFGTGNYPK